MLLSTWLNQDDLETVELLDEGQRFLKLSLALRDLQGAVQKLQSVLALDVLLSRTQGLVRIEQSLGLTKGKKKIVIHPDTRGMADISVFKRLYCQS